MRLSLSRPRCSRISRRREIETYLAMIISWVNAQSGAFNANSSIEMYSKHWSSLVLVSPRMNVRKKGFGIPAVETEGRSVPELKDSAEALLGREHCFGALLGRESCFGVSSPTFGSARRD